MFAPGEVALPPIQDNDVGAGFNTVIVNEQVICGSVGATLEDLNDAIRYVEEGVLVTVVDSCIPISAFQVGLDRVKNCTCIGKIVIDDFTH